jgi:hypothetical protein
VAPKDEEGKTRLLATVFEPEDGIPQSRAFINLKENGIEGGLNQ